MCDNFEDYIFISTLFVCYWLQVPMPDAQWGQNKQTNKKKPETSEFGAEKLIVCLARRRCGSCPQNTELPKGLHQSIFKGKVREGCG